MKEFWITVYKLKEHQAKTLWNNHKTRTIHCTVLPDKTGIYGTATDQEINAIVNDIIALGKDYGFTCKDIQ
jgi:hypothetical protein